MDNHRTSWILYCPQGSLHEITVTDLSLLSRQHSRLHFTIVVPARETARHNLLLLDTLHPAHTWYKRASRIHHEAGHLSQSPWIWSLWCH